MSYDWGSANVVSGNQNCELKYCATLITENADTTIQTQR